MTEVLEKINALVWGIPALLGILGIGLYLSIRTHFAQLRLFPRALRSFWQTLKGKGQAGEGVSPFQALCTALAATVGTGNLAGVAGAIAIGGGGNLFPLMRQHQRKVRTGKGNLLWKAQMGVILWMP